MRWNSLTQARPLGAAPAPADRSAESVKGAQPARTDPRPTTAPPAHCRQQCSAPPRWPARPRAETIRSLPAQRGRDPGASAGMANALPLRELLLREVDVTEGLDLFEQLLVLGHVENHCRAVSALGQDHRSLGLADALNEGGDVGAELRERRHILIEASPSHGDNVAYNCLYIQHACSGRGRAAGERRPTPKRSQSAFARSGSSRISLTGRLAAAAARWATA